MTGGADFAVFAATPQENGHVSFDVLPLEFEALADPSAKFASTLLGVIGARTSRPLRIRPERCSYYCQDPGTTEVADRFPPVWHCGAVLDGDVVLPASDGPFDVPGWEPRFYTEESIRAWPGWPADVTVVGGFPGDVNGADEMASSWRAQSGIDGIERGRTGAGVEMVRGRVRLQAPADVQGSVMPVLETLERRGAFIFSYQHIQWVANKL